MDSIETPIDELLDAFSRIRNTEQYDKIPQILDELNLQSTDDLLLVGYVASAWESKAFFEGYADFYNRARKVCKERGHDDSILFGFEPDAPYVDFLSQFGIKH